MTVAERNNSNARYPKRAGDFEVRLAAILISLLGCTPIYSGHPLRLDHISKNVYI
jgi:hypothetical protein